MECYKFCFVFLLRRKLKPHFFLQKCEISQMLFSVQDEKYGLEPALLVWKHCLLSAFNLFAPYNFSFEFYMEPIIFVLYSNVKLCYFHLCCKIIITFALFLLMWKAVWCHVYITSSDAKNSLWSNRLDRKRFSPILRSVMLSLLLKEHSWKRGNTCSQTGLYYRRIFRGVLR